MLESKNKQEPWTVESVKVLADKLPSFLNIDIDALRDQWRLYQLENIADGIMKDKSGTIRHIDHYRRDVLATVASDGCTLKYDSMGVFVKSHLVITHGNSDVEIFSEWTFTKLLKGLL